MAVRAARKYLKTDDRIPSEKLKVCEENVSDFFKFMHSRHMAWHRRFILKLPKEQWTKNKILIQYKYTNVYRQLDRGTLWAIHNIIS